jgi:very-short-patch-repair endonuclease
LKEKKKFDNCKGKRRVLSFDFYLPKQNMLIEYDGRQHFMPVNFYGCSDEKAQKTYFDSKQNDAIKDKYCIENNIQLIRIPYTIKNVEQYLKNNINN